MLPSETSEKVAESPNCHAEPCPESSSGSTISASHQINELRDPEMNSG
jgi:hypothetical protein